MFLDTHTRYAKLILLPHSYSHPYSQNKTGNSAEVLKQNDAVIGKVMKEMQRDNHPFVGIFTGEDVEGQAEEPEEFRPVVHVVKKREAEAPKKTGRISGWGCSLLVSIFLSSNFHLPPSCLFLSLHVSPGIVLILLFSSFFSLHRML